LIALNIAVFIWELMQPNIMQQFGALAIVPCEMSRNFFSLETVVDSLRTMFLHSGWMHIISNMLFLAVFGPLVEDYLGKARYLFFYLATGFIAGFVHTAVAWNVCVPVIGASGAVYGVLGAFLLLYPATRIRSVALLMRIPVGIANVHAFYLLLSFILIDVFNALSSLGDIASGGVAFWAHVGGFVGGLVLAFPFMLFRPPPEVDAFEYLDAD
jgi:membrane associated rhomboid family serine protease